MSVLVEGMNMPKSCEECAFVRTVGLDKWKCELSGCKYAAWDVGWADGTDNKYIRHSSCPLVPVPDHGRLIDADALKEFFPDKGEGSWTYNIVVSGIIRDAPTIIEAEDGEE